VVSDYGRIIPRFYNWGFLLSSDTQSDYVGLGNADGTINESRFVGQTS